MTKTFTIRSKSKIEPGPAGMGPAVIQGIMTLVPTREAIHCSDVGLNTIQAIFVEQNSIGSNALVNLVGPGSYDNYASLSVFNGRGTARVNPAGTLKASFLAFGR